MPAFVATGLLALLLLIGCQADEQSVPSDPKPVAGDESDGEVVPDLDMAEFLPNPDPVVQAIGNPHHRVDDPATDRRAHLEGASELGALSLGVEVLAPQLERNYGTYELVELIRQVGVLYDQRHPGAIFQVGDLSLEAGGTIRDRSGKRVHSSHRNGLDVDINFLRTDCHEEGSHNARDCPPSLAPNLELMQLFLASGPPMGPIVDLFYVHHDFYERACNYVYASEERHDEYSDLLRYMEPRDGHQAHFHMRIRCPALSRGCRTGAPPSSRDRCGRRLASNASHRSSTGG